MEKKEFGAFPKNPRQLRSSQSIHMATGGLSIPTRKKNDDNNDINSALNESPRGQAIQRQKQILQRSMTMMPTKSGRKSINEIFKQVNQIPLSPREERASRRAKDFLVEQKDLTNTRQRKFDELLKYGNRALDKKKKRIIIEDSSERIGDLPHSARALTASSSFLITPRSVTFDVDPPFLKEIERQAESQKSRLSKEVNDILGSEEENKPDEKEENKPEENKLEENKPEENKPDEKEESKPEENKLDENKPEENKPEENKPEENKPEENKPEENKPEENKPDEKEESKPDENKLDENKPEEKKLDENKPEEKKLEENKPEEKEEQKPSEKEEENKPKENKLEEKDSGERLFFNDQGLDSLYSDSAESLRSFDEVSSPRDMALRREKKRNERVESKPLSKSQKKREHKRMSKVQKKLRPNEQMLSPRSMRKSSPEIHIGSPLRMKLDPKQTSQPDISGPSTYRENPSSYRENPSSYRELTKASKRIIKKPLAQLDEKFERKEKEKTEDESRQMNQDKNASSESLESPRRKLVHSSEKPPVVENEKFEPQFSKANTLENLRERLETEKQLELKRKREEEELRRKQEEVLRREETRRKLEEQQREQKEMLRQQELLKQRQTQEKQRKEEEEKRKQDEAKRQKIKEMQKQREAEAKLKREEEIRIKKEKERQKKEEQQRRQQQQMKNLVPVQDIVNRYSPEIARKKLPKLVGSLEEKAEILNKTTKEIYTDEQIQELAEDLLEKEHNMHLLQDTTLTMKNMPKLLELYKKEKGLLRRTEEILAAESYRLTQLAELSQILIKEIIQEKQRIEEMIEDPTEELEELTELLNEESQKYTELSVKRKLQEKEFMIMSQNLKEIEAEVKEFDEENEERIKELQEENKKALDELFEHLEDLQKENNLLNKQYKEQVSNLNEEKELVVQAEKDIEELNEDIRNFEEELETLELTREALESKTKELEREKKESNSDLSSSMGSSGGSSRRDRSRRSTILYDTFPLVLEEQDQNIEYYLVRKCSSLQSNPLPIKSAALTNTHLWCGHEDGWISIWQLQNGQHIESRKLHNNSVSNMLRIGEYVWAISADGSVHIFNHTETKIGKKFKPIKSMSLGVANAPTCAARVEQTIWIGGIRGNLRVFDLKGKKIKEETFKGQDSIECIHQRGQREVWLSASKNIFIVDIKDIKGMTNVLSPQHKGQVHCITSVGPYEVWTGGADRQICCWSGETYQLLRKISFESAVFTILEDRKYQNVVIGCRTQMKVLRADGSLYQDMKGEHTNAVPLIFMDTQGQLWSCSWDGSVNIWRRRLHSSQQALHNEGTYTDLSFFAQNTPRTFKDSSLRGRVKDSLGKNTTNEPSPSNRQSLPSKWLRPSSSFNENVLDRKQ